VSLPRWETPLITLAGKKGLVASLADASRIAYG
jgi:hypothetical protein